MGKPTKVYLMGKLGALFGQEWELHVNSPAEAIRAIDVNLKGKLREYLSGPGARKHYRVALQKKDNTIDPKEIPNRSGSNDIYIVPTVSGSGSGAKILLGVVLIAVAFIPGLNVVAASIIGGLGASLVLGGVMELLTPTPKDNTTEQRQSANFQGNAATVQQGAPVPLVYGRALVFPTPICVSHESYTPAYTATSSVAEIQLRRAQDGVYEYISRRGGSILG